MRVATAIGLMLLAVAAALSQGDRGSISGIVIDARSQTPLPGTVVVIPGIGQATTDDTGQFRILNVVPGRHHLQAFRSGMAALPEDRSFGLVTVASGEDVHGVRLRLAPFGVISGQIRDDHDNPAPGVSVLAFVMSYQQGRRVFAAPSLAARPLDSSTQTDEKGEYRLELPPGIYYVCVKPKPTAANPESEARVVIDTPRACYPGTSDMALAATVHLNGSDVPRVDFKMAAPADLYKVYVRLEGHGQAGLAANLAGGPIGELRDRVTRERFPILGSRQQGPGAMSPSVVIEGVPNGSYDLFIDGAVDGGVRSRGIAPIDIRGDDLHDVIVMLQPTQDVAGRLVNADPSRPTSFSGLTVRLGSLSASVARNGDFVVTNVLPGSYSIAVEGLPSEAFVSDIRSDSTSLLDTAQSLTGPEFQIGYTSPSLQIMVGYNGGAVDGVIESREPASGATVVLVPASSRRFVPGYYKTTISSPAGTFAFNGVPPGQYQLFAWENVPDTAWLNPEFMSHWDGRGQPVTIWASGTVNVRVRLFSGDE